MSESVQDKLLELEITEIPEEPKEVVEKPKLDIPEKVVVKKERKKRSPMSEEQKEKLRENLKKARLQKQNKKKINSHDNKKEMEEILDIEDIKPKLTLQQKIEPKKPKKPKKEKVVKVVEEKVIEYEPEPEPVYVKKITNLSNLKKRRY